MVNIGAPLTREWRNDFFKDDMGKYGKRAQSGLPFMLEGKPIKQIIKENLGEFNNIYFIKTENQTLQMFFSGNIVFFISTVGRAWKRSIVFSNVERAKLALRNKGIIWVESGVASQATSVASGTPPSA